MTAQTTSSNWVFGSPTNTNTRVDTNPPTNSEQSGAGFDWLTRMLAVVDAWLWIVFAMLIVAREVEVYFGVLSGFDALIGPSPTMLAGAALIVGGAAYLTATTHAGRRLLLLMWWLRLVRRTPESPTVTVESTAPQPEWKVRTQPRTQTQRRSSASQRVMEMEL